LPQAFNRNHRLKNQKRNRPNQSCATGKDKSFFSKYYFLSRPQNGAAFVLFLFIPFVGLP
jgi:hypothetical protein